jgi:hypothetical protein
MSKRDRLTLKKFFSDGALPGSEHYGDLIESMVNRVDDGFDKTDADGLRIASLGGSPNLISLYRGVGAPEPAWILRHGGTPGAIEFRQGREDGPPLSDAHGLAAGGRPNGAAPPDARGDAGPALALGRGGRVGIHRADPEWRLDVDGVARMGGRIGVPGPRACVPADGRWHDITGSMSGCQMLEIVAGAGGQPGRGRYALMHAIALNAYNPRNALLNWLFRRRSIRRQDAMFGSYADRLRLRWTGTSRDYRLQIRTQSSFGADLVIRYYVTRLWFDSAMQGSRSDVTRDGGVA